MIGPVDTQWLQKCNWLYNTNCNIVCTPFWKDFES